VATVRCLANVRLAAGSAALQAKDVFRTGRPRDRSVVDPDLPVAIVGFEEVKSTLLLRHCLARVLEPLPGPGRQPNTRGDQKTSTPDMVEDDNID